MARFRERFEATYFRLSGALLEALLASYREWGGTAQPPTVLIVDYRGVPTWSEFEILQERFEARGVPTVVADPRELAYERGTLVAGGRPIDLVYRRVLINDILAHPDDCAPLVRGIRRSRASAWPTRSAARFPHKKAFFAVLTDERHQHLFTAEERALLRSHVPWTRLVAPGRTTIDGQAVDLLEHLRTHREHFVIKPNDEYGGAGVMLGWESDEATWGAGARRGGRKRAGHMGRAAPHPGPPRGVPDRRDAARGGDARHAGRSGAVHLPWPRGWIPHAPEQHAGSRT